MDQLPPVVTEQPVSLPPAREPVNRLAVVVTTVAAVVGAGLLVREYAPVVAVFPAAAVLGVLLLVATVVPGTALLRRVRPVQAPPVAYCAVALGWGMTAAVGCAVAANTGLGGVWAKTAGVYFADAWGAALTAPFNEEPLKLCGVVLLVLLAGRAVRTPVDGWVLGALVGLGFQVVENLTYALNAILLAGASDPSVSVMQSFVVRVGVTGWGSHWAMSAVAGTGVGVLVSTHLWRAAVRRLSAVGLLVLAMAMHLGFDALVGSWAVLVLLLVNLVVAVTVYLLARRSFRTRFRAAAVLEADAVPPVEARLLMTRHGRRRARAMAHRRAERSLVGAIQQEQLALVEGRVRVCGDVEAAQGAALRADIAGLRDRLSGVQHAG